jgi:hypothetical protein
MAFRLKAVWNFQAMTTRNRATNRALCQLSLGVAAAVAWAGCGQSSVKLSSADKQALDQAPPEVKQVWQRALAADKANDYTNALSLFDSLQEMQLTEAQKQAVYKEREAFSQRLWQAAEKNDPAAVKAVQASQQNRRPAQPASAQ